ncbi:hypothetical protein [Paenibacillus sp. GM2FR]|nr:hypothetical protein [Paenibacillus sp. GM2FR]
MNQSPQVFNPWRKHLDFEWNFSELKMASKSEGYGSLTGLAFGLGNL